jgi:ATP/maltotriose-dependent transcriptional regulator MalT
MKTAEQILEECKQRWKENDPKMESSEGAKQAMIEALILYAEQVIDECADLVLGCVWPYTSTDDYYVDTEPILNLKKQLK